MREFIKRAIIVILTIVSVLDAQAQIGNSNIAAMNNYIVNYAASQMTTLGYYEKLGMIEQQNFGITDRYKIQDIKRIEVGGKDKTFVVQFFCDEKDPCISQTKGTELGKYIPSISYFFTNPSIANSFAQKAGEIIREDFKNEVVLKLFATKDAQPIADEPMIKEVPSKKVAKEEPKEIKEEVVDHLSLDAYSNSGAEPVTIKNPLVKKIMLVVQSYTTNKLEPLKGAAKENAWEANVKLPKAKKNYINQFKGQNCFVAEFGTEKFIDDLEETYSDLQDALDEEISQDWETVDHSQDEIYADSEDDIYHVEYINQEKKDAPSITLMIVPDGKRYTLFMRIGSR